MFYKKVSFCKYGFRISEKFKYQMSIHSLYERMAMQIQKLAVKEQLVKRVVKSGNGGAVWVPKNWLGQEIIVILPDKPKMGIKEWIVHLIEPYLNDVIAAFIYGSYARNEATEESDVDVMVITKGKRFQIKATEPNLDIAVFELDKLKKSILKYPVMYYQIVQEAEPLINHYLLEELKDIKISHSDFKDYIRETKKHIESNKEFIELDKLDSRHINSYSALYSIILRLRGTFIMQCILDKKRFSNRLFLEWLTGKGVTNLEFEQCYSAYRSVKKGVSMKNPKIKIFVAEKLLNILIKEAELIEAKIHG